MDSLFYELLESVFMKFSPKKSVYARTLTSLTALAMFVALTDCSNNDDAAPDLEETIDASESDPTEYIPASEDKPAHNVPEPRIAALATEPTEEGALETLQYFWEAAQYARLSGDTGSVQLVSSSSCEFCASFAADWREVYDAGQWAVSHGDVEYEVQDVWKANDGDDTQSVDVLFTLSEPSTKLYDESGQIIQAEAETEEDFEWFALLFYDSTAQLWEIEWIGLEELVTWED